MVFIFGNCTVCQHGNLVNRMIKTSNEQRPAYSLSWLSSVCSELKHAKKVLIVNFSSDYSEGVIYIYDTKKLIYYRADQYDNHKFFSKSPYPDTTKGSDFIFRQIVDDPVTKYYDLNKYFSSLDVEKHGGGYWIAYEDIPNDVSFLGVLSPGRDGTNDILK